MSFRNGDKSREHRLRKAKAKKRVKVRELNPIDPKQEAPAQKPAKKATKS